jgi:hypothetical protein
MFRAFPSILIAVLLYNAVLFGGQAAGQHDIGALLAQGFAIPVVSGDLWKVTLSDLLILLALAMLFVETIKATRTTTREIINHALSLLTFIGAMAEFLVVKGFGTSTFFFITAMCLFDVVAGYSISIVAAKRDVHVMAPERDADDY